ncbi:MAG: FHA domain-containing protein, partial [Pseudarthrobacter sp.]|nr:FHA domain-containing protein [Pseudarthrobacter sp.]
GPVPAEPAPYQQTPGDAAPASEQTTSYDHLWDRTVMRNIEDAAVREDNDADAGAGSGLPAALPAADQLPALEKGHGEKGDGEQGKGDESTAPDAEGGEVPSSPHPGNGAGRPAPRPAAGVLIDAVPWRTGGSGGPAPASSQAQPAVGTRATPGTPTLGIPPTPGTRGGTEGPRPGTGVEQGVGPDFDPDHDGQTVMKGSLPGLSAQRPPVAAPARDDAANGPLVLARVCAQGHPNPPTAAHCACGAALLPDAVQVPRPRLGRMRLSTGELLDLDQSMVIGRQPSVSRVQGGVMPRLVQVASPGGDISRSHVEVRLEGWHVMLCDLKATNGTVLVREGQPPRRLAQNEMAILLDGDIAELGDNISLRFEEIP